MAHRRLDGVQQYASGAGTGNLTLGTVTTPRYRTLAEASLTVGETTYLRIENPANYAQWEISLVTMLADGIISRTYDANSVSPTGALIVFPTSPSLVVSSVVPALSTVGVDSGGNAGVVGQLWAGDGFHISGLPGAAKQSVFYTNALPRWSIGADNAAEGGADAGAEWTLTRYSDAGASLGVAFKVMRSTGAVQMASVSANALTVGPAGATNPVLQIDASVASQAAGLKITGAVAAGNVDVGVISSGANANLRLDAKGTGTIAIGTTSTGNINLIRATVASLTFGVNGQLTANASGAPAAGGSLATGLRLSSTANLGLFVGSGAPTIAAAQGSLYMRTDGTTTNDRFYVRGSAAWIALTAAS